jgi:hypothetical protein
VKSAVQFISTFCYITFVLANVVPLATNAQNRKPHLIVGNWKQVEEISTDPSQIGKPKNIDRWYFSSDGYSSHLTTHFKKKEIRYRFTYKVLPNKTKAAKPHLQLINPDKKYQIIVFEILELTKKIMVLQLEPNRTNTMILLPNNPIEFERIAGPPENME